MRCCSSTWINWLLFLEVMLFELKQCDTVANYKSVSLFFVLSAFYKSFKVLLVLSFAFKSRFLCNYKFVFYASFGFELSDFFEACV